MKKKVFSLMMTLLLAFVGVVKADVVELGGGSTTTNSYLPTYEFYNYSLTQQIYTADEIGTAGTINSIAFYTAASASRTLQVYMVHTSLSAFSGSTAWIVPTSADMVFSGSVSYTAGGWTTLTLSTPFEYNGTDNLCLIVDDNTGSYVSSVSKYVYNANGNQALRVYSDGTNYNALAPTSYSGTTMTQKNRIQLDITPAGGGAGAGEQLFAYQNGVQVDTVKVGPRPNGYWMEPFTFQIHNTGAAVTVTNIDWTPNTYFSLDDEELLPFDLARDAEQDVKLNTGDAQGNTDWQMVAIYGTGRTAAVWNINVEQYDAQTPDVWELACEDVTSSPFDESPAADHNATLYTNYNLPFTPDYPDGYDAVYKLVFDQDVMLNAYAALPNGGQSKVVLYTEDFYGEGGPMVDNYYQGPTAGNGGGGGAAGGPFEAMIGDDASTTTSYYMPMCYLYNYSLSTELFLATELAAAGVTTSAMSSISWYSESTYGYNIQNVSIWMANVTETEVSATSPLGSGMSLVYQGNFQEVVGWNEFVFNAGSFAWDGHSNVMVMVQMNNGNWSSSIYWKYHNPGFYAGAYVYQDSTPYSAGTTTYSLTTTNTVRANTKFKSNGRSANRDLVDFESGNLPAGWDASQGYNDWYVDTEDYYGHAPAYAGTYSLYVDGNGEYDNDYFVSPATEFAGAGSLSFAYATPEWAGDQNDLSVGYSTSPTGPWTIFPAANELQSEGWQTVNLDLSSLNGTYYIAFISYDGYGYCTAIDNINLVGSSNGGGQGGGTTAPANISYGPVIENAPVEAGTYYLVSAAQAADYGVHIEWEPMPCPDVDGFAFNEFPADDEDEVEPASVTLQWMNPPYATSCQVFFGSTYYPQPNHPQTVISDVMPVNGESGSFTVTNLWNNTNYFWYVKFFNEGACQDGVEGPHWGFTTHLNIPQNLVASDETIFNDETVTLTWNAVVDRTYRNYFIYRDGVKIGETAANQINATTYTDGPLAYNMGGYTYYVTAVYDEGESAPSNTVVVKVSGYGDVNGHVYEQDGTTGIANATVTMVGTDEFGVSHTYNLQTNAQGYYSGHIYAGEYNGSASCNGYQTINEPVQGNPIDITYNQTTSPIDYILDENFDAPCAVIAEYFPDSLDPNSPYVKVYWGCGLPGGEIIEDFETGDFSMFDWNINGSYPWEVTTTHPYEGTYCMRSTNYNVASSTSSIDVTVDIPADGIMSFYGYISSENNWDYGYFYIDGVQKGSYTGAGNSWGEKKFDITEGTHNFKWSYTKDGSVNSNEDRFYVDYITFYKQPEPAQPGWHTYCESEFNNAVGSSLTTTPSWAYEYPASFLHANYAGWNITKVSLFSDNMYSAVGGNYTCRIYVGGTQPAAGTMVSELTVDVPSNQNAWVDWDLTTPVSVTGNDAIWVVWTANSTVSSWPAGCCGDLNDYGTWWDGGNGWEHLTYGTWTMRHWFTNRAGRSVALGTAGSKSLVASNLNSNLNSNLRTPVKGEESNAICANENAVKGAALDMSNSRSLNHYRVYRTNCYNDGPYTTENTVLLSTVWVPDTVYIDVEWADLEPGVYKWGVGAVYAGNRGEEEVESEISWSEPVSVRGNRDLAYDFDDNTMQGWTSIDADGDGNGWVSSSNPGIYHNSGVNLSGTGHNSSEAYVISGSYANQTGQVLYPDNYLVSPQIALGGSITFYACAQDASYAAEHFGVAVSTTNNTSASAFTTIQEWTMTAKGEGAPTRYTRDGGLRQGSWYQYTVDLSSYSGMGYVAIRHFNCSDEFILNVDDITIVEGAGGGGGQGGNTNNLNQLALERESETMWSNCLDKDMYLDGVTVTVLLNSADSPEGTTVDFTNLNEYEQQTYGGYNLTLEDNGYYAFESFRRGDYAIKVALDGYETIFDTVSIWENMDLRYVMIEILYGVENIYVSRTGWAMWDDSHNNPGGGGGGGGQGGGTGDTFSENFDAGMPAGWTTIDGGSPQGYGWHLGSTTLGTGYGHNGSADLVISQSYDNNYGVIYPDNYLVSPQVNLAAGSQFSFWACAQDANYAAEHFGVAISDNGTSNWTMVNEWTIGAKGERYEGNRGMRDQSTWTQYTVDLSAYAGQKYIAIRHFNCSDMYFLDVDDVALTNGGKNADEMQHFEYYKVMCTSIDGVPIYNHNTVWPFCQLSTNEPYNAPLVEGEHYLCKVATVYSTGMSAWSEPVEWEYEPCDHWGPVDEVTVDVNGQGNHIEWVFEGGYNPYDPNGGQGGGGTGTTSFTEGFEGGLNGWNVLKVNADGGEWLHSSNNLGGYDYSTLAHGGTGFAMCYSYVDYVGAYNTDAYLYTPQKYSIVNGSTLTFFADNANDSYPENFSVCVATADNPTASDFTTVWSGGAKGNGGAKANSHHDANRYENWRSHSIDLSAYAGQDVYIAFHDVNYDMYEIWIDDVALTGGAKDNYYGANETVSGMISKYAYAFDITDIDNFDERVFFLHNMLNDNRFEVINSESDGVFVISASNGYENMDLEQSVKEFRLDNASQFAMMDKAQAAETALTYKAEMPATFVNNLLIDRFIHSRLNDMCELADPICSDSTYFFPAPVGSQTAEPGPDYDCLYTQPRPVWYYFRIGNPGAIEIYMHSNPQIDIDFCCWGPFDDPVSPCPYGLTTDKVVDCSYSSSWNETCNIPATAQTGEYYILVITNYNGGETNITFSQTGGAGTTDCEIVHPTYDLIGFLITQDGEYLDIVGPELREYTDVDEFGEHVYCVRPIYPGEMVLPDHNYGWSMGCPVCNEGGDACAAGAPIHGEPAENGDIKVWWGEQEPGPGCEGDEFTVDFEAGLPAGWTTIDADGDGYNWNLASATMGAGYGHNGSSDMMYSQSYDNNYGALTPDNWLVTPAVTLCENSTFSFYACAQDNAWASEHFGVAVSEDGTNFTMVQEWTMTAKGERYDGPRGMRDQGNWYQYTVDLGAYAGEGRKIAIRHFNCTDWFYLDIDDIQLSAGAKATRDGIVKYNVYRSTENANYALIGEVPAVAGQTYYEYIDRPESAGNYYYQVTAVYADCESEPAMAAGSDVNYVVVGYDNVNENGGMAIFPNPTKGNVTIQANDMRHITVVSVLGQVVYDADVTANEVILNMSQYSAGMYTVRVMTENGMHVERISVIK